MYLINHDLQKPQECFSVILDGISTKIFVILGLQFQTKSRVYHDSAMISV